MIKILITDDSPTDTAILKSIFESEPNMSVIACARDGEEAVALVEKYKPDIVTMDIRMPRMDGYQAIEMIMSKCPTPIVVISSIVTDSDSDGVFRALEAGALTVLPKGVDVHSPKFLLARRHIIDTIKTMSQIRVVQKPLLPLPKMTTPTDYGHYHMVVIGASIGGPHALKEILSTLPADFPVPILVVQHMTEGFIKNFTQWLDAHVNLKIKYAEQDELLKPGVVYFAPDYFHFEIKKLNHTYKASLVRGAPVSGFCPSITVLMNSVAKNCGKKAIGALLTGMGDDGAEGLLTLKKAGANTILQDPASCVVFGMGAVAQSMGAVTNIVTLNKIADYLITLTKKHKN